MYISFFSVATPHRKRKKSPNKIDGPDNSKKLIASLLGAESHRLKMERSV